MILLVTFQPVVFHRLSKKSLNINNLKLCRRLAQKMQYLFSPDSIHPELDKPGLNHLCGAAALALLNLFVVKAEQIGVRRCLNVEKSRITRSTVRSPAFEGGEGGAAQSEP